MNNVLLLLGGNLACPKQNFIIAEQLISNQIGMIKEKSSLFKSKSWGFDATDDFLNQVLQIDTQQNPVELLKCTQAIELKIGRETKTQDQQYQSRLIDIDILFFNNEIIEELNLIIPHPKLHLRNFALAPLQEISPELIHPKLNKSVDWLYTHTSDLGIVEKLVI